MNHKRTLSEKVQAVISQDRWDHGTSPENAAEVLRGIAADLEQKAKLGRK